jgi:hypothetical protein
MGCTAAERRDCCLQTYGLPVDEAGAVCLAQVAGMPVGIEDCPVWLEESHWVVSTIIENECTTPYHKTGWLYHVAVADGAVGPILYAMYTTINSCPSP